MLTTWTLTIQPQVVTKAAKIVQLTVSYTQKGAAKTEVIPSSGATIYADPNTPISISVTYQNTGDTLLKALPWITVYKDTSTYLDTYYVGSSPYYPYTPIELAPGATDTKSFPTFTMPNATLTAEIRIYDWEELLEVFALTLDTSTILPQILNIMLVAVMLSLTTQYAAKLAA